MAFWRGERETAEDEMGCEAAVSSAVNFMAYSSSNSRAAASLKADAWRKCTVKIFHSQVPGRSSDSPWLH